MKLEDILPPVTQPWSEVIERRHKPPESAARDGYRSYRSCLRWEFAFSCAFCLCHEADLATGGVVGWGLTAVEHFVPQSKDARLTNVFDNCFYTCGRCNRARGAAPNLDGAGRVLLNPCQVGWGERLVAAQGQLQRRSLEDDDMDYTLKSYGINDEPKVRLRRLREETIEHRKSYLEKTRGKEDRLLDRAIASGDPELVDLAQDIYKHRRNAAWDLRKFRAVPLDHESPCRCEERPSLPKFLERQTFDLSELYTQSTSGEAV